jgi:cellulose synthase/poly-beta-1,6-N-acetylglucosamine synthase-like glycosyltransferase
MKPTTNLQTAQPPDATTTDERSIMSYTKSTIKRALLGFPLGVFASTTIVLAIALARGDSAFSAAAPDLVRITGSVTGAFLLQYVLSGILGSTFAGASIIFQVDNWSLLRQTVTHFAITFAVMMVVATTCQWAPASTIGLAVYIGVYIMIYVLIWASVTLYWRRRVAQVNAALPQE